jgi:hypothetical protein
MCIKCPLISCRSALLFVLCLAFSSFSLARAADVVYFDRPESAKLFDEAEVKGQFWTLVRYFISEKIDTFCGVASSIMVLNALEVPSPVAKFTYPYNKFDEDNFFTPAALEVQPVHSVAGNGQTLEQLAGVLRTFGLAVEAHHADTLSLDRFRALAVDTLKTKDRYIVVNFSRVKLTQEGSGHFSPLAAYDRKSDRFLLMDVARYKYPPAWVKAQDLWNAMNTDDKDAKAKRGFVIIGRTKR